MSAFEERVAVEAKRIDCDLACLRSGDRLFELEADVVTGVAGGWIDQHRDLAGDRSAWAVSHRHILDREQVLLVAAIADLAAPQQVIPTVC